MFRNHQNGSFDILQRKKKMAETLENIAINYLFKNVDEDKKFEKQIMNCLCTVSLMKFYLFQVQNIFGFVNVQCTITTLM